MAYILHIDTSGSIGLVAISKDGKAVSEITESDTRNHASSINLNIEEALKQADITMQQLDAVSVCGGPGSYTGLRIGLATAKGICYILDKPLMMHNKLTLLATSIAYGNNENKHIISILQARENEYFCAVYDLQLNELLPPKHHHVDELEGLLSPYIENAIFTGSIDEIISSIAGKQHAPTVESSHPQLDDRCRYAEERFKCNDFVNLAYAEPFYLKQVYTHKPKNSK
ncbi:MAG: tRNA (adenosine(37)-N6)-threonylcarbamoyltransferase complex dimerization subunit type 1 TsaB [Chitinophagales bacterium]|nr:tRNA (adenosine(37)-N6)-threonylcarbamoyltransferase complex dimerization subunit type 1 TsaB [Chitinophagaceae bacterium]MCB9065489.1 tRNA (adenosine(37)-N6)-threonylcarbamoyltransferase complex dimerization subunit type 1 TsaB [Chitinophagales bacterium]